MHECPNDGVDMMLMSVQFIRELALCYAVAILFPSNTPSDDRDVHIYIHVRSILHLFYISMSMMCISHNIFADKSSQGNFYQSKSAYMSPNFIPEIVFPLYSSLNKFLASSRA